MKKQMLKVSALATSLYVSFAFVLPSIALAQRGPIEWLRSRVVTFLNDLLDVLGIVLMAAGGVALLVALAFAFFTRNSGRSVAWGWVGTVVGALVLVGAVLNWLPGWLMWFGRMG